MDRFKEVHSETMTDEQIRVMADTLADVEAALDRVPSKLAESVRSQQHRVAETARQARSNRELLDLRVGGMAVEAV